MKEIDTAEGWTTQLWRPSIFKSKETYVVRDVKEMILQIVLKAWNLV